MIHKNYNRLFWYRSSVTCNKSISIDLLQLLLSSVLACCSPNIWLLMTSLSVFMSIVQGISRKLHAWLTGCLLAAMPCDVTGCVGGNMMRLSAFTAAAAAVMTLWSSQCGGGAVVSLNTGCDRFSVWAGRLLGRIGGSVVAMTLRRKQCYRRQTVALLPTLVNQWNYLSTCVGPR